MKKFELIIEVLSSKEEAQQRRVDPSEQKLVEINDKTGEIVTGILSRFGSTSSYYLVSNSTLIMSAQHTSPEFPIEDRTGRKIKLFVQCEVSCPPGNEEKVAKAFHSTGKQPVTKLNRFIASCINAFRGDDEQFIDNFFALNINQQIEDFIINQNEDVKDGEPAHITGLKFHTVKCIVPDLNLIPIRISLKDLKIGFMDSVERHAILFDCDLALENKNSALLRSLTKSEFEELLKNAVSEIFHTHISENDVYDNLQNVEQTLKNQLDERLQKYGRKISAIKLVDLYLKDLEARRTIRIEVSKRKFFALDGEAIELEIWLTTRVKNIRLLKSYKEHSAWLKNELEKNAANGIGEFISAIGSGDFYSNIDNPNSNFKERFIQTIRNKVSQIIEVEITDSNINTGREGNTIGRENWTSFSANIDSVDGKCSIEGSFIVTGSNLEKRAMQELQKFTPESIKNKIVETLEAWLDKYSASTIVSANLREPENFEKFLKKLLMEKIDEAHGITINIQNIKTKIVNPEASGVNIDEGIAELDNKIITGLIGGLTYEKIEEYKKRKLMLLEFKKERREALGYSAGSSNQSASSSDFENGNALLRDVNRLLLEENFS